LKLTAIAVPFLPRETNVAEIGSRPEIQVDLKEEKEAESIRFLFYSALTEGTLVQAAVVG
jgi:hypothetical protein